MLIFAGPRDSNEAHIILNELSQVRLDVLDCASAESNRSESMTFGTGRKTDWSDILTSNAFASTSAPPSFGHRAHDVVGGECADSLGCL